jgi:membrane protein implicated in regulation of membrane protease activity
METLAQMYATHPFWIWVALGAAILAVEILTGSGWLLWASASAGAVAVVASLADLSFPAAVLLYAALTIASTLLARRYLPRSMVAEGADINDNIGRLIGHRGRAVAAFDRDAGRVFIDGKEWAAELEDGDSLPAGASVEVTGVSGSRLRVRGA